MGLFGSDKNLAAQLKDALAKIDEQAAQLASLQSAVDEARAEVLMAQESSKQIEGLTAQLAQVAELAKTEGARADALHAQVEAMKASLANPAKAYADAVEGKKEPVAEGGEAQARKLWAQYNAISDGRERTLFYRRNKEAMDAEAGR